MASPVDTFKNSLFGQLKSYGDAVQGVFEQRIARPLLAFKRDLSRTSSTTRAPSDQGSISPSTPVEIIDSETNSGSIRTILDKVKNTLTPTTKRRTSEDFSIDDSNIPIRQHRHSSITSLSNKNIRKSRLQHQKSVSFAEHVQSNTISNQDSMEDQKELVHNAYSLADDILLPGVDEATTNQINSKDTLLAFENDFEHHFHPSMRPRRCSIGHSKDLIYQDLSAEIVAYVLKHALRQIENEDKDFLVMENEHNEDFIDLK